MAGTAAAPTPPGAPALQGTPQPALPAHVSPHHLSLLLPKDRFPLQLPMPLEVSGLSSTALATQRSVLYPHVTLCPGAPGALGACPQPACSPPAGTRGVRAPQGPGAAAAAPLCGAVPTVAQLPCAHGQEADPSKDKAAVEDSIPTSLSRTC